MIEIGVEGEVDPAQRLRGGPGQGEPARGRRSASQAWLVGRTVDPLSAFAARTVKRGSIRT